MGIYDEPLIRSFERACERYPDHTAIIYIGEKFSYKRLKELIDRFATALYDLGVRDNDKVMLYIPNCPQFLIGYFGAQQIGAIPVPVSPIYTPYEIKYLINDSGAETVLCQHKLQVYPRGFSRDLFKEGHCHKLCGFTSVVQTGRGRSV